MKISSVLALVTTAGCFFLKGAAGQGDTGAHDEAVHRELAGGGNKKCSELQPLPIYDSEDQMIEYFGKTYTDLAEDWWRLVEQMDKDFLANGFVNLSDYPQDGDIFIMVPEDYHMGEVHVKKGQYIFLPIGPSIVWGDRFEDSIDPIDLPIVEMLLDADPLTLSTERRMALLGGLEYPLYGDKRQVCFMDGCKIRNCLGDRYATTRLFYADDENGFLELTLGMPVDFARAGAYWALFKPLSLGVHVFEANGSFKNYLYRPDEEITAQDTEKKLSIYVDGNHKNNRRGLVKPNGLKLNRNVMVGSTKRGVRV